MRRLLSALLIAGALGCTDLGLVGENKKDGVAGSSIDAGAAGAAAAPPMAGAAGMMAGAGGAVADAGGIAGADAADTGIAADAGDAASADAGGCSPACGAAQICDPSSGNCFECRTALDCEVPDECDDCAPTDLACVTLFCRACTTDADCLMDEPRCGGGLCRER